MAVASELEHSFQEGLEKLMGHKEVNKRSQVGKNRHLEEP